MSKSFRHSFLKRSGIILLVLLSFVNARFTEAWHFHTSPADHQELLKTAEHRLGNLQESCSLCHAAHLDIISFKAFTNFFFYTKSASIPFLKVVFKTSFALIFTSSRAPPALF